MDCILNFLKTGVKNNNTIAKSACRFVALTCSFIVRRWKTDHTRMELL